MNSNNHIGLTLYFVFATSVLFIQTVVNIAINMEDNSACDNFICVEYYVSVE